MTKEISMSRGTMTRLASVVFATMMAGAGALVMVNRVGAAAPTPAEKEVGERAAARVAAAEQWVLRLQKEADVGNVPLTPSFVEIKSGAQRRLAEARMDAAVGDSAARLRAAEEYVDRSKAMVRTLELRKGNDPPSGEVVLQAKYFLADAEYLLAKVRAGG